jgi:hypothetical protein
MCLGCRKKDDGSLIFDHRVIAYSQYFNNALEGTGTFEYKDNKLIKVSNKYYSGSTLSGTETVTFTYPDANTIHMITTDAQSSSSNSETVITVNNNKPVMSVDRFNGKDMDKQEFFYNSDGTLSKMVSSYNVTSWTLLSETNYTYTNGKLTQISTITYSGTSTYEDRHVFTYNGDNVTESVASSRMNNLSWTDTGKETYTYTGSNLTSISHYYKSGSTWILSGSTESFSFDADNNLIMSTSDGEKTEYTYQDGTGNVKIIIQALGSSEFPFLPAPHKKSLNLFP